MNVISQYGPVISSASVRVHVLDARPAVGHAHQVLAEERVIGDGRFYPVVQKRGADGREVRDKQDAVLPATGVNS
jgi:hypothetical protein